MANNYSPVAEISVCKKTLGNFDRPRLRTSFICNGNRTEEGPIRSVMSLYEHLTKSDDREAGVRFVETSMIIDRNPISNEDYSRILEGKKAGGFGKFSSF